MNHFDLLEIPLSFFPDAGVLRRNFYRLSREYHPDLQGDKTQTHQDESLKKSSDLNEAYRTLSVFDKLVPYVLRLKGIWTEGEKQDLSPAFLMEMMDLNETLMDAKMEGDTAALASSMNVINTLSEELMEKWQQACQEFDQTGNDGILPQIKEYFFQYRYLLRLKEQING